MAEGAVYPLPTRLTGWDCQLAVPPFLSLGGLCRSARSRGGSMSELTIATAIFLVIYGVIVSKRLDRTVAVLAGAALMIAFGILDQR